LRGVRVLLTRAPADVDEAAKRLRDLGAVVVEAPLIRLVTPPDERALAAAAARTDFDWIAFASVHGVEAFVRGRDRPQVVTAKLAAVGPATARAVRAAFGRAPDLVPASHTGAALGAALAAVMRPGERVLLVQALDARPDALEALAGAGCAVETVAAYATQEAPPDHIGDAVREADVVVLASGSAARSLRLGLGEAMGATLSEKVVVCIGPITADEARHAGVPVTLVPDEYSMAGVIDVLVEHFGRR
jgi:uroporphyrinogen-III synthase